MATYCPAASGGRAPCCAKMRLATGPLAQTWLETRWAHHPRVPGATHGRASSPSDENGRQRGLNIRRRLEHVPVRLRPRAPTTSSSSLRRRQQADPNFSDLCFDTRMAGTKRKPIRPGAIRKPLSKSALLPMPAQSARELSLAHHLALAACRGDRANRHQINELVRSVYMFYYLERVA